MNNFLTIVFLKNMFLINNYMAFININHYKVLMYKNSTIIASIALSFALFFTFANLNLVLGQNVSSSGATGGNSTSAQNQTGSSLNQTQSGTSGQAGQSQSHSAQSQSQSGPVGQTGSVQSGPVQSGIGASNQGPLTSQIEKQIQTNQANQTGRSEHY
jgi:hypothetical protein